MSSLPNWAGWVIVAACPLLGPVIAFLVFLAVVVLDRWITGAREAPAIVPVAVGVIGGYLRRRLAWGASNPAPELVHSGRLLQLRPDRNRRCNSDRWTAEI
jgi:hypothetical protein